VSYKPESGAFIYSSGYSNPGREGVGDVTGCGGCSHSGRGGASVGDAMTGKNGSKGAGGSGGGNLAWSFVAGGAGGDGVIAIYY